MIEIRHQFENQDWFIPNWKLKILILGTFNPECGHRVEYFYGRKKNQLWPLMSDCLGRELNPNHGDQFFTALKEEGIGCMDILRSIHVPEERKDEICGKGYSDQKLFRGTNQRTYMTDEILGVVERNPEICILPTWGKGQSFLVRDYEQIKRLPELPALPSPSPRAGGFLGKKDKWCAHLTRARSARLENFRSLMAGNVDDLDVESLFVEFKWLVSTSKALFHFEIGESWYDNEEGLQLSMTATYEDGRYLLLTTDNHGELCIDARRQQLEQDGKWTGSKLDMVAKLPRYADLTEKVPHLVMDFLDEDYGRHFDGWYREN